MFLINHQGTVVELKPSTIAIPIGLIDTGALQSQPNELTPPSSEE